VGSSSCERLPSQIVPDELACLMVSGAALELGTGEVM
jgi:hypothetical protein